MNHQTHRRLLEEARIARLLRRTDAPLSLDRLAVLANLPLNITKRRLQALEASGQVAQVTMWQAIDPTQQALGEVGQVFDSHPCASMAIDVS